MNKKNTEEELSVDDILNRIRNTINYNGSISEQTQQSSNDNILELSAFHLVDNAASQVIPKNSFKNKIPTTSTPPQDLEPNKSTEELIKKSLEPMLKNWLDKNLHSIVKQLVEKEIKELTSKNN